MDRLFVYGSLQLGHANEHVMNEIGGEWCKAVIKGRWRKQGWGYEKHGLRAMVIDPQGDDIPGFIFTSEKLNDHWTFLDEFEGGEYERVKTRARTTNGDLVDVFVYALKTA